MDTYLYADVFVLYIYVCVAFTKLCIYFYTYLENIFI